MLLTDKIKKVLYDKSHCTTEDNDSWYFDLDNDTCYDVIIFTVESFTKYNVGALLGGMDFESEDDLVLVSYNPITNESTIKSLSNEELDNILIKSVDK